MLKGGEEAVGTDSGRGRVEEEKEKEKEKEKKTGRLIRMGKKMGQVAISALRLLMLLIVRQARLQWIRSI